MEYKQVLEDSKKDYRIMLDYKKKMMLENKEMHDTTIIHPRLNIKIEEMNEEQFKQYRNEKFTCKCGGYYTRHRKSQHKQSLKHKKWLESQKLLK